MEASNLKNMVVLKNLPSNIVDEAIIILKNSKKIKKLEKVENNKTTNKKEKQTTQKDYILKEAEMLVNSYVSKIENKEDKKFADNKMQQKYKKIKKVKIHLTFCPLPAVISRKREITGGSQMKKIEMPTLEELQEMAAVDIRTVDKSTLVELDDVEIHEELPQAERIADYIKQIKNPYCYKSHGIVVKISFAGKCSLEESLSRCISM